MGIEGEDGGGAGEWGLQSPGRGSHPLGWRQVQYTFCSDGIRWPESRQNVCTISVHARNVTQQFTELQGYSVESALPGAKSNVEWARMETGRKNLVAVALRCTALQCNSRTDG